jgi:hypothetical protein
MSSWFHKRGGGLARALATIGAVLVLFAQIVGAAHFHEGVVSHDGIATPVISASEGLCPLCQLAFHSPGSVGAAPTAVQGAAIVGALVLEAPAEIESPVMGSERGRSPPQVS